MREPPVKKVLYWCPVCNIPLLGRGCGCGAQGKEIHLLRPHDVRPALREDHELISRLLSGRYGTGKLPRVVLFNKTGGIDRKDLIIANGDRFGWLSFDPVGRDYSLELSFEALAFLLPSITMNVVKMDDLQGASDDIASGRRVGGKRYPSRKKIGDGGVVLTAGGYAGTGFATGGMVKIRQVGRIDRRTYPDPSWEDVAAGNSQHLKNLERNAIRFIRQHTRGKECVNVSFSGGKDSTAVRELARRAGVKDAYFVDTGMEFPETLEFVKSQGIGTVLHGKDFWKEAERRGPPRKDDRWCCEILKLAPVKEWLSGRGKCVTVQGNRWYESFSRSGLPAAVVNPYNPAQENISPIRNWRALEVFLYIWWRGLAYNPLYDLGLERVGCWMCPAMLESEFEYTRRNHPDLYCGWMEFLKEHCRGRDSGKAELECGMWRWNTPPPKMRGLVKKKSS